MHTNDVNDNGEAGRQRDMISNVAVVLCWPEE